MDFRAIEIVQNQIAFPLRHAPLFQKQNTAHSQPRGTRGGQHGVIGLRAARGKDRVTALVFRIRQQELKFADFVSAHGHAAEIVALDVNRPSVFRADGFQFVTGGWKQAQRQFGQILWFPHDGSLLSRRAF